MPIFRDLALVILVCDLDYFGVAAPKSTERANHCAEITCVHSSLRFEVQHGFHIVYYTHC